jgi:hypothetical protein
LLFEKKILSLYCSPANKENWLAKAAQPLAGYAREKTTPTSKIHSPQILE